MKTIAQWIPVCAAILWMRVPCFAVDQPDAAHAFSSLMVLRQVRPVVVLGVAVIALSLLIRYLWTRGSR